MTTNRVIGQDTPSRRYGPFTAFEWACWTAAAIVLIGGSVLAFRFVTTPTPVPLPPISAQIRGEANIHGYIDSADDHKIVLLLGNGKHRTLHVKDGQADAVGVPYLKAHEGKHETGFIVFYRNEQGVDYAIGAIESSPPPLGEG